MTAPTQYCSVPDILALVSLDAQARLASDPGVPVPLVARGNGLATTFDTPFAYASEIATVVGGTPTPNTIIHGGGRDGIVDQVAFATAPSIGALLTASADINAVNIAVIRLCIGLATDKIKGSLARYGTEALPPDVMAVVHPMAVFYTRWYLRERRSMNDYAPIIEEFKSNERMLLNIATGKTALPASAPIAQAIPASAPSSGAIRSEPSVYEPPGTNFTTASGNGTWW